MSYRYLFFTVLMVVSPGNGSTHPLSPCHIPPHHNTCQGHNNRGTSKVPGHLMQITFRYYSNFPHITSYTNSQNNDNSSGCAAGFKLLTFKPPYLIPIIHCTEQLTLLRPEKTIKKWQLIQEKQGYILLSRLEHGLKHELNNTRAYIYSVANLPLNNMNIKKNYDKTGQITGIFIHHTRDIRRYSFQNRDTGKTSYINATPFHRFYMKNKRVFVPISAFSDDDAFLNHNGNTLTLLCNKNRHSHCGKPLHPDKPVPVYNVEVYPQHTYYAGKQQLLAHNSCWFSDEGYSEIERFSPAFNWPISNGRRNRKMTYIHPQADLRNNKLFRDFFSKDLEIKPFYRGYNKPEAWRFGKYRKFSHSFTYRKLDNKMFFLESGYTQHGPTIIISTIPLDVANTYKWEFTVKPADTFSGHDLGENHLEEVRTKLLSFLDRPLSLLSHNCQHLCDHIKGIFMNS